MDFDAGVLGSFFKRRLAKSESNEDKSDEKSDDIAIENEEIEEEKIEKDTKEQLTASKYFKPDVEDQLLTGLLITKDETYLKSERLFKNRNAEQPEVENKRNLKEEGHYVSELPNMKYGFIKKFIADNEIFWSSSAKDGFKTEEDPFNPMEFVEKEPQTMSKNVEPLHVNQRLAKKLDKSSDVEKGGEKIVLELEVDKIRLINHPLNSIEHVLEQFLLDLSAKRQENKIKVEKLESQLKSLRNKKKTMKAQASEFYDNERRIYKYGDFQKVINSVKDARKSRMKCLTQGKSIDVSILSFWKAIELVRNKNGFVNTAISVDVTKRTEDGQEEWEKNFEMELLDMVDEIKCEYYMKRKKYKDNSKTKSTEKLIKPVLDYDEDELEEKLKKEMNAAFTKPGDSVVVFEIRMLPNIISQTVTSQPEIKRRNNFSKSKYSIKISVNDKDVCKSRILTMDNNFTLNLDEKYWIHLTEKLVRIKLTLIEKYNVISSNVVDLIIPASDLKKGSLSDKFVVNVDNIKGFGINLFENSKTLQELLTKYVDVNTQGMDGFLHEKLAPKAEISVKVNYDTEKTTDKPGKVRKADLDNNLSCKSVVEALEKPFDPNDPENSFLVMHLNGIKPSTSENKQFHFESDLFLNFAENFDEFEVEDRISNESFSEVKSTSRKKALNDAEDTISKIDKQRHDSIQKLQSMNTFLFKHTKEDSERDVSNLLTIVKYPTIKSITIDFLNPKKPLLYQSLQSLQQIQTQKDYVLKLCIFKAFHLPSRLENEVQSIYNTNEEGVIKMMSLRPFVEVNCQGQTKRTTTAIGSSPTWNDQMSFSIRFNMASVINFHLFDEVVENLLVDDRLEDSTVHYQFNPHWLGSLKIPLSTIFSQIKVEGTFMMHCPVELLGYKQNIEDKYPVSRVSYDSLRRETTIKQKDDIFLSIYMEIIPKYVNNIPPTLDERLNSNEVELILQHLILFRDNFQNQFPERYLHVLVIDSCGKSVCLTRYFQPIPLFDFNECLKQMFFKANQIDNSSSISTTPRKKGSKTFEKEDIDPNKLQSIQSKSTKDIFEIKSLNDDFEVPQSIKLQMCMRFVAMIPTYKIQTLSNQFIVLAAQQTLKLMCGSMFDHTILLMGYFMQLGVECWCIAGHGLPRGFSTYVLVRENTSTNELHLKSAKTRKKSVVKMKNLKYCIIDATSGNKFDIKDSFCPLQSVYFICNNENMWANVQSEERSNLMKYDLTSSSDWRPVFQKGGSVTCPGPLPGSTSANPDSPFYEYDDENTKQFRDILEEKIKSKVQKWRGHRKTIWNRNCSKVLRESIINWEKWSMNTSSAKPKNSNQFQQLQLSYKIYGFPLNLPYTTSSDIVSAVKGTQLYLNNSSGIEFALGVEAFPYPNRAYSIWIYLASITKR